MVYSFVSGGETGDEGEGGTREYVCDDGAKNSLQFSAFIDNLDILYPGMLSKLEEQFKKFDQFCLSRGM